MKPEDILKGSKLVASNKELLSKPAPSSKAPTGKGYTKADVLLRRLQYDFKHDPLSELVALAKSPKTSTGEKIRINQEFMSYIIPKLKNVEVNQHQGEVIKVNITFPEQPDVKVEDLQSKEA